MGEINQERIERDGKTWKDKEKEREVWGPFGGKIMCMM